MTPPAPKTGLLKSEFLDFLEGEPQEISAHKNGIHIRFFLEGVEGAQSIILAPRHIEAIRAMTDDWWESWWADLHEEQA